MKQIDPSGKGRTAPAVLKKDALRPGRERPVLTPGTSSRRQELIRPNRIGDLPNPADRKPAPKKPAIPNKSPKPKAINKPAFNKEAAKKFALAAFRSKKGKE
jgi:hypothetical protein